MASQNPVPSDIESLELVVFYFVLSGPEITVSELSRRHFGSNQHLQPNGASLALPDCACFNALHSPPFVLGNLSLLPRDKTKTGDRSQPSSGSFHDLKLELPKKESRVDQVSDPFSVSEDEEALENWSWGLTNTICQMMFVSGETSEASVETTTIIEEIVHTQVTEIVSLPIITRGDRFSGSD